MISLRDCGWPISYLGAMFRILFQRVLARALLAALLLAAPAHAHRADDSYLVVDATQGPSLEIGWEIGLRDLDRALGLDADHDGAISAAEVGSRRDEIDRYALAHLQIRVDGHRCALVVWRHRSLAHSDGRYLGSDFHSDCASDGRQLVLSYRLFFALDPLHRGLLRLRLASGTRTAVLGPEVPERVFELGRPGLMVQIGEYFRHGVWHIWGGVDHILFLLSLLLPSVLVRDGAGWRGAARLRDCLGDILRVVTAFTLAHSVTLSLAALGLVTLPGRLVESTIAASVLLAALNNLVPRVGARRWMVAFGFGLIHGFGFASVLADLGLPRATLSGALIGFNLGVEAGQLAIVLAFIPLAWPARNTWIYRRGILGSASLLVALLAAVWLLERAGEFSILPFKV